MLPVNDSSDIEIIRDENVVRAKVWMSERGPAKPFFLRDKVWCDLNEVLKAPHVVSWIGLLVIVNVAVLSLDRHARFGVASQPGHLLCGRTEQNISRCFA